MKFTAQRMQLLSDHFFSTLGAKIASLNASGKDVIRLDEGSPDMPPPAWIIEALTRSASRPDHHGYQPHRGSERLRRAWAAMYQRTFGVELDPDAEVLPLLGSKEGIFHLALACLNPGEVALIPDPGYITYTRGTLMAGGEPYYLPLRSEQGYLPDLQAIPGEIARRAKMMWLNYPNNPTTAVADLDFFSQAVAFAREYGILLCHDAAYTQITYDGYRAPSLMQVPGAKEVAVEFNTLSKSHNMAGWRVGVVVGNPQVLRSLYTLKTNLDSSHFRPVLDAAASALEGDQSWTRERNQVYRARRDAAVAGLRRLGLTLSVPCASIYIWSKIPPGWSSALDFTNAVLEEAAVSLTPGTVFGANGEGHFRLSLTAPLERIAEAMTRLEKWRGA